MKSTWTHCAASAHLYMRRPTHRRVVKLITPAPHTECVGFQLVAFQSRFAWFTQCPRNVVGYTTVTFVTYLNYIHSETQITLLIQSIQHLSVAKKILLFTTNHNMFRLL